MIRNIQGGRVEETTILPEVHTKRFRAGYGRIWLPEKRIDDVTEWTRRNADAIVDTTRRAGCLKVRAELRTENARGMQPDGGIAKPRSGEIVWNNLNWFDGLYDLTLIPHWDWTVEDSVEVVALGQQGLETPRKNPSCNAPTDVVGSGLLVRAKAALANISRNSGAPPPEGFYKLISLLRFIRSPEQRVVLLNNAFEIY